MLFNSVDYLIFFPLVLVLYYHLQHRFRWILLLVASYTFYMYWKPIYGLLLLGSTLTDYFCSLGMQRYPLHKGRLLLLSLTLNLGLLFTFKYLDFFIDNMNVIFGWLDFTHRWEPQHLVLPVGISFYTFQTISYTIDVYRGQIQPTRHLGKFALFVSFFPQLVAGPIERASRLLPQFDRAALLQPEWLSQGARLILLGLVKKLVLADNISNYISPIFDQPFRPELSNIDYNLAGILFLIQLYCDFSSYCDIAQGSAKMLGIDLMDNFKLPFLANRFNEVAQRWHMSLYNWLKDYVFMPLVDRRPNSRAWALGAFVFTYFISGLWHGAHWTYVISLTLLGALAALFQLVPEKENTNRLFEFFLFPLISAYGAILSATFFRAPHLSEALHLISGMHKSPSALQYLAGHATWALIFFLMFRPLHCLERFYQKIHILSPFARFGIYLVLITALLLFGYVERKEYIYFQF